MTPGAKTLCLKTEDDTSRFAASMAKIVASGDVLLLEGEIGAGKSAFARGLIRALAGAEIEVPSPTFTLVQTYDLVPAPVWHCDLYRLTHPDEAFELGLEEAFETAICLIEWPDRLGSDVPAGALKLHFTAELDRHSVTFTTPENWVSRLQDLHD